MTEARVTNCMRCAEEAEPEDGSCWHDVAQRLGLEQIGEFDDPDASYSFDKFRIWKRKSDGALFYGTDSGCSCPSPFEDVKTIADLTAITVDGFESFKRAFAAYCGQRSDPYNEAYTEKIGPRWVDLGEETKTVDMVREMLKDPR